VSVPIGCDTCIAEHAPFLLLSGIKGTATYATADLVNLATAINGNEETEPQSAEQNAHTASSR
jgi:hypothetical protein